MDSTTIITTITTTTTTIESKRNPLPIFLLSDSRLLFEKHHGNSLLEGVRALIEHNENSTSTASHFKITAAYIGASNGDQREFYEMFQLAVEPIGILPPFCRMIPSERVSKEDIDFLNSASIILLAGGDCKRGDRFRFGHLGPGNVFDSHFYPFRTGTHTKKWFPFDHSK